MKLVIQIPAYNEEQDIVSVLTKISKTYSKIDDVKIILIDDGSTDNTCKYAEPYVDKIIKHEKRLGLAKTFFSGVSWALKEGADIIINLDGDGQYKPEEIPLILDPLITGSADVSIGSRPITNMPWFSSKKKFLQIFGTFFLNRVVGSTIKDYPCGFRAMSRKVASQLVFYTTYTYTIEMNILGTYLNFKFDNIDITVNEPTRPSRLIKSNTQYILRAMESTWVSMIRYKKGRLFFQVGSVIGIFLVCVKLGLS
ncbi:glycosyltransferase family 2 protein [bacterium]|nr:glycosyltransferase family 2 protein [bacterium]